jgi:hypothetical protein
MSAETTKTVLEFAAQTGRLDFISTLLACISVLMVFGGVFAYINIQSKAENTAKDAAEKKAEEVANFYLQKNLTSILESYEQFIRQHVTAVAADEIARAQENGTNGNGGQ